MSAWNTSSSVLDQINDLAVALARLCAFRHGNPHAPAATLDAAHAVLRLAVATAADEDEQMIRREAVTDAVAALAPFGLEHIRELTEAAFAHDVVAGRLVRSTARSH